MTPHQAGRRTRQRRDSVRQAPIRSLRPTGGCRVGDRARPTNRTKDSPKRTSAGNIGVRPGLGTHPHADQSIHRSGGSFSDHLNPRCRDGDSFLTLRCQASGHDGPMKRATWVFLITIVAAVSILCASDAPSGATTAQRPALCNALKPEIQADQRLPSILADMRSRTMSETKRQLYANQWLELTSSSSDFSTVSAAVTLQSDFEHLAMPGPLKEGGMVTIKGHRVRPISSQHQRNIPSSCPGTPLCTSPHRGHFLPVGLPESLGKGSNRLRNGAIGAARSRSLPLRQRS